MPCGLTDNEIKVVVDEFIRKLPDVHFRKGNIYWLGSHPVGRRYINILDETKGFIPIPRICSSVLVKEVNVGTKYPNRHWIKLTDPYVYDEKIKFMVVIRDPWERYLSGLFRVLDRFRFLETTHPPEVIYADLGTDYKYQILQDPPNQNFFNLEWVYHYIFELKKWLPGGPQKIRSYFNSISNGQAVYFDEHTAPQTIMHFPFLRNELITIPYNKDTFNELVLTNWFDLDVASNSMYHNISKEQYPFYDEYIKYFTKKLKNNTGWLKAWQEVYKDDIKMWETGNVQEFMEFHELFPNYPLMN